MKRPESTTSSMACFISGVTVARERGIMRLAGTRRDRGSGTAGSKSRVLDPRFLLPVFVADSHAGQRHGVDLGDAASADAQPRTAGREGKRNRSAALGRLVDRGDDLQRLAALPAVDRRGRARLNGPD